MTGILGALASRGPTMEQESSRGHVIAYRVLNSPTALRGPVSVSEMEETDGPARRIFEAR